MKKNSLQTILNHQIQNVSFSSNLGLFAGKTGTLLFLFYYARHSGAPLYEEFASELLDEIYEDIHTETPVYFHNGLCGIAWAIEYLLQEKYVEGESDEILSDIDEKIMKYDPRRIHDYTLQTGLEGIAWYALSRLISFRRSESPFDELYINDLLQACRNVNSPILPKGINAFIDYMENNTIPPSLHKVLIKIIIPAEKNTTDELSWQKGIKLLLK